LPAITEINSGATPLTARIGYIAVGEFGVPLFAPWALTVSYPEPHQPYILPDGSESNGASALRDLYSSLTMALPQISYYAASEKLKVFLSNSPGLRFIQTADVNDASVTVSGEHDGQAIVIHPSGHESLVVGYRAQVSWKGPSFTWPAMKEIKVARVVWSRDHWESNGEPEYEVDQSRKVLSVSLDSPQAIHVSW